MERSEPTSHTSIYLWGPGLACVRLTVPAAMRLGELREAAAVRYAAATFDDQPPRLVHHGRELTSDLDGWLVTRATSLRSDSHFHMFPHDSWGVRPALAGVEAPVLDSEPESALGAVDQRGRWPSELGERPRLDVAESGGSPRRSSGHLAAQLISPCDRLNFSSSDEE